MARCSDCFHFSAVEKNVREINAPLVGECRESPPKVFMIPVRNVAGDGIGFQAIFPQVAEHVWCGAYADREVVEGDLVALGEGEE